MTSTEYMLAALALASGGLFLFLLLRHLMRQARQRIVAARLRRARPDDVAVLRAERERLRAEKAILQQRLEARIAEMTAAVAEAEARATRALNELGETRETLAEREETLAEREAEIERLKEMVATLEKDLEKRTAELADTRADLRETRRRLADLEAEHRDLKRERNRLQHRLEETQARLAAVERKLEMREAELAEFEKAPAVAGAAPGTGASATRTGARDTSAKVVPMPPRNGVAASSGNDGRSLAGLSQALMGQVVALDRLKAMLAGRTPEKEMGGDSKGEQAEKEAPAAPSGTGGQEEDLARLRAELDELDRLWQERLAALRKATEVGSGKSGS